VGAGPPDGRHAVVPATVIDASVRVNMRDQPPRAMLASAASAPRGALLYPRLSREGLEGRFLGLMAYLEGKPEGNNSMPGK